MKIAVLDPELVSRGGHHFDFDRKLAERYAAGGHEVAVYGAFDMRDDVVDGLRKHGAVSRAFRRTGTDSGESRTLAEDLRQAAAADVWIWPSFGLQHLNACNAHRAAIPIAGCIHEAPGLDAVSPEIDAWRAAFRTARSLGLCLGVGSIEPEVCDRFRSIMPAGPFRQLPQPFDGPPIASPREALKRIGFFGYQRPEKGAHILGPLIARLLADGYAVTLQNSNERVSFGQHARLDKAGFVEDFAARVAACDLIVLSYAARPYGTKGSGPLAQCLALGLPAAAPAGTLPGRMVERHRMGPLFDGLQVEPIYRAVKAADRDYASYAVHALAAARTFARGNGTAKFAAALLAAAGVAPAADPIQPA